MTLSPTSPLDRPVLFFGGKGGVGKTTLATAAALRSAEEGARTLLVSTDPAHSTADLLDHALGAEPIRVAEGLDAMEIDPDREAERYIAGVKKRLRAVTAPRLVAEVERQIDIARVSPGAEEAALFDRFAELMQRAGGEYDRVIFDTAPTGHTLRLLSLPELMGVWIEGLVERRRKGNALGRMWRTVSGAAAGGGGDDEDPVLAALEARRDSFRAARRIVTDPARAAFVFVLTPERLPFRETERAVTTLRRYGIPIGAVLVNQVVPRDAGGAFLAERRRQQEDVLSRIGEAFPDLVRAEIPLWPGAVEGPEALGRIAACLP